MRVICIAILIILATNVFAQNISVSQVSIIPSSPTTTDTVKIATVTGTLTLGVKIGFSHFLSQDTIYITGCFLVGPALEPTTYYDTVTIGILPIGTYHVVYEARGSETGECDSLYTHDWGQADFEIGFLSIDEQDKGGDMQIFPNPSSEFQAISLKGMENKQLQIDLYDIQGRLIRNVYKGFAPSAEMTINTNVADLHPALYFYHIRYGAKFKNMQFVKY